MKKTTKALSLSDLNDLLQQLYDAAQQAELWGRFVRLLCDQLNAESALLRFFDAQWGEVRFSATHGFDPGYCSAYQDHFCTVDPILEVAKTEPSGSVRFLEEVVDFKEFQRTEFYNDYMRPQDKRHVIGGFFYDETTKVVLGLQRGQRGNPFEQEDLAVLKVLAPHLVQALRITRVLSSLNTRIHSLNKAVDSIPTAVFFLDATGRVQYVNSQGDGLLREGQRLVVRGGRLTAVNPESNSRLQKLIVSAAGDSSLHLREAGGAMELHCADIFAEPICAVVSPWIADHPNSLSACEPVVAVFVGDCDRFSPNPEYLAGAYGLTRTESRLVAILVRTCCLDRTAKVLGVRRQTARDYLKSIFRKMDCHSQTELIKTVLTGPAMLWSRNSHRIGIM